MVNTPLCVSFVALLAAAAGAQSRSTPEETPRPLPLALDAALSRAGTGIGDLTPQDPVDYSQRGQFLNDHRNFMMKSERYTPMAEFSFALMPDYEIKGEAGGFDLYHSKANIDMPIYIGPDAWLSIGAYGSNRHYQVKNNANFGDENLSSAGMNFGLGMFFDPTVQLQLKVSPGVWSDMDGSLKHNDYDMPGSALLTWEFTDDTYLKIGARYNQVFKEAPWLPYLGISWALGENFRVDVLLPESAEISYWPDSSLGFLFGAQIDGAQYRVRTSAATGRLRTNVQVQEVVVYTGIMSRLSDGFSIMGRVGATVAGDYHLSNGDKSGGMYDGTLDPGLFLEFSAGFDF